MIRVIYIRVTYEPPEDDEDDYCPSPVLRDTTEDNPTLSELVRTLCDCVEFSSAPVTNPEWTWATIEQDQDPVTGDATEVTVHPAHLPDPAADDRNRARWAKAIRLAVRARIARRERIQSRLDNIARGAL